jgi:hypothetical protein
MRSASIPSWLLVAALALACESFVEAESEHAEPQPGAEEAQYDLDDALCWQEVGSEPGDTRDEIRVLHDECMRAKGWTDEK